MLVLQGQVKVDSLAGNEKQARGLTDSLRLGAVWGGRWEDLTQLRTSPADAHSPSSLSVSTTQPCITRQGCFEVLMSWWFFSPLKQPYVEISISAWVPGTSGGVSPEAGALSVGLKLSV